MKSGRILVGILFAVGLAGTLITGKEMYARLLYVSLLLVLVALTWTRVSIYGLKVERRARLKKASVGDFFEEHFEILNDNRFTAQWVEVSDQSNLPRVMGSRLLTLVNGRQTRTYLARTWLTRRGRFMLGPTTLTTGDLFGFFRTSRTFPATQSVTVLPALFEIEAFPYLPGFLPGGQVIRRRSIDITPHASNVREYAVGDPLKRIHWPSTARRGRLMVKEFDQDPQAEIWILLDIQSRTHVEKKQDAHAVEPDEFLLGRRPAFHLPPSTLEYAISISASLSHFFSSRNRAVGLVAAGRHAYTVIQAERGERQESKILETLAFLDADGNLSVAALAAAQAPQLPSGSGVVIVTPSVRKDLLAALDDLLRRNLRPVVILLMAESFGGQQPGGEGFVRALTERGVPVCPIFCDADLRQALASFSNNAPVQDHRTWQSQSSPSI